MSNLSDDTEPVAYPLLKIVHDLRPYIRPTMISIYRPYDTTTPNRITRSAYLVRWLLFLVGSFMASRLMTTSASVLTLVGAGTLLFLFVGLFRWVLIPRLHDMGVEPAWAWSLLFFVHGLSFLFLLALLLVPTDTFAKRRYGY